MVVVAAVAVAEIVLETVVFEVVRLVGYFAQPPAEPFQPVFSIALVGQPVLLQIGFAAPLAVFEDQLKRVFQLVLSML